MSTTLSPHVPVTGPELRAYRHLMGLTQAAMGACLGCAGNTVARMERSELPIRPPMARLIRLIVAGPWPTARQRAIVEKELNAKVREHLAERRLP